MLVRIFSAIVTSLFVIITHGQSYSAEISGETLYPKLDINTVQERFSKSSFDYKELKDRGVDVLNSTDEIINLSSDIFLNCYEIEEKEMLRFLNYLSNSSVTSIEFQNLKMTLDVGEAFVSLLKGEKRFNRLDLKDLEWKELRNNEPLIHDMIQRIGLAATKSVNEFHIIDYLHAQRGTINDYHIIDSAKFDQEQLSMYDRIITQRSGEDRCSSYFENCYMMTLISIPFVVIPSVVLSVIMLATGI